MASSLTTLPGEGLRRPLQVGSPSWGDPLGHSITGLGISTAGTFPPAFPRQPAPFRAQELIRAALTNPHSTGSLQSAEVFILSRLWTLRA